MLLAAAAARADAQGAALPQEGALRQGERALRTGGGAEGALPRNSAQFSAILSDVLPPPLKAYRTFRNLLIASTFQTPLLEKGLKSNDDAAAARGEAIRKGSKAGLGKAAQAKAAAAAKKAKEATAKAAKKAAAEALHAKKLARQATFGGRGKQHALSSIFGKTYYELQGWTHVFHVFGGHAFR